MATDREYDPPAMTEEERLGKRRYEAYFAFEMGHPPVKRSRLDHFGMGMTDHIKTGGP